MGRAGDAGGKEGRAHRAGAGAGAGRASGTLVVVALLLVAWAGVIVKLRDMRPPWRTRWAERVAEGRAPGLSDFFQVGWYQAAWASFAVLLVLAVLGLAWYRLRLRAGRRAAGLELGVGVARLKVLGLGRPGWRMGRGTFWLLLACLVALATWERLPRMGHSLWGDEAWPAERFVHGSWRPVSDDLQGQLEFVEPSWRETAFDFRGLGSNHLFYSVLARLSSDLWRGQTGAAREEFAEWVLRMPSLVAGLLSLVGLASLLGSMGRPGAGLVAAALWALHPWHIRYATEARGYALVGLFLVLVLLVGKRALETGRWRWWLAFGLCEVLAFYSWMAAMYPLVTINLALVGLILWRGGEGGLRLGWWQRGELLWRYLVASGVAALCVAWLCWPAVLQLPFKLESMAGAFKGAPMDGRWYLDTLSQLMAGVDFYSKNSENLREVSVAGELASSAWRVWASGLLVGLGIIGGLVVVLRRPGAGLLLVSGLGGAALAYLHFLGKGMELNFWYLYFATPFGCGLVGLGLVSWAAWLHGGWRRAGGEGVRYGRVTVPVLVAGALVFLWSAGSPLRQLRAEQPQEDLRRAMSWTRWVEEPPFYAGESRVETVWMFRLARLYDPRGRTDVRDVEGLRRVVAEAREGDRSLYVIVGHLGFVRAAMGDFYEELRGGGDFEWLVTSFSQEMLCTLEVWRMVPVQRARVMDGAEVME